MSIIILRLLQFLTLQSYGKISFNLRKIEIHGDSVTCFFMSEFALSEFALSEFALSEFVLMSEFVLIKTALPNVEISNDTLQIVK